MSLDGVDFRVNEPHPFDRRYYSHKFNHAGLKYEIGLSFSGKIVWVAGGIPCGVGDRELAESSLANELEDGETVMADLGYRRIDGIFVTPVRPRNGQDLTFEELKFNKDHKRIMCRHENVNSRMKVFKVLSTTFRHHLSKHTDCVFAIAQLTSLMLQLHPLPEISNGLSDTEDE